MNNDEINHPPHYTRGEYEVIDVIEDWGLNQNFCLGNVIKYIARAGHKHSSLEGKARDLMKARWYLDREIQRLTKNE